MLLAVVIAMQWKRRGESEPSRREDPLSSQLIALLSIEQNTREIGRKMDRLELAVEDTRRKLSEWRPNRP